jgi:hypothetical protein
LIVELIRDVPSSFLLLLKSKEPSNELLCVRLWYRDAALVLFCSGVVSTRFNAKNQRGQVVSVLGDMVVLRTSSRAANALMR